MTPQTEPNGGVELAEARRLLASCRIALLDMNSTFMFGEDRLGPEEDFAATYRAAEGAVLSPDEVAAAVQACVAHMSHIYEDPAYIDDFPCVREVLDRLSQTRAFPEAERTRLAEVIARHEVGRVPTQYANAIRRLAGTHRLGLVANIWAPKDLWLAELARAGLDSSFAVLVFSSDSRSMKPSRSLFAEALRGLGVGGPGPHRDTVFIGDSLRCDIAGAQAADLQTIWINPTGARVPRDGPRPDASVPDLVTLVPPGQPA